MFTKTTKIEFGESTRSNLSLNSEVTNVISDKGADTDFNVNHLTQNPIKITPDNYSQYMDFNIFDLITFDIDECSFCQITYINGSIENDLQDLRFSIKLGDTVIGKMSEFTLTNLKEFIGEITIYDLDSPRESEWGWLNIIVGKR